MIRSLGTLAACLLLSTPTHAQAPCPAIALGPLDNLPVMRDACLIGGEDRDFARLSIPTGPATRDGQAWRGATTVEVEGRLGRRLYAAPEGVTPLDAFRNLRDAMAGAGLAVLFDCAGRDCGANAAMGRNIIWPRERRLDTLGDLTAYAFSGLSDDHYAALQSPDGALTVALYVARNDFRRFPETYGRAILHLDVIRRDTLPDRMIDAAAMRTALDETGKIALEAIRFDFATATLTQDSAPTLDQMARLLDENPAVQVYIVGHTDNVGTFDANLALSRARAEAVVAALVARGIAAPRVVPAGVADLSPVAPNTTEEGRARNRRVEMVQR
jgi:OmpA-OmpF porin, OOP family